MVPLPKHWVLNYSYDNDGGCALTALVNGERLHVTVDVKELQDRSKAGKQIRREYQNLLYQVQAEASGEVATHQTAPLFVQEDEADSSDDEDSGVDVRSPQEEAAKYCYCNTSESGGPMIACDGEQCEREWFHFKCVGIDEAPKEKQWYCDDCL